jgi:hypothetical protein
MREGGKRPEEASTQGATVMNLVARSRPVAGLVFFLDADFYFWTAIVWIVVQRSRRKGRLAFFFGRRLRFLYSHFVNCALG